MVTANRSRTCTKAWTCAATFRPCALDHLNTLTQIRFVWKPVVFVACLVPFALAIGDLFGITGSLGANPVEELQDRFGNWGLRFVMLALAVTPLRHITGKVWLLRFPRKLGLFAYLNILVHLLNCFLLDQSIICSSLI